MTDINKTNICKTRAWKQLAKHAQQIEKLHMRDLFQTDSQRFNSFSIEAAGIFLDYSKNRITQETFALLMQLAEDTNVTTHREVLFSGGIVNDSEQRPALHTALRSPTSASIKVNESDIMPDIHAALTRMRDISDKLRRGQWLGFHGEAITDVVNIGIGGSDLGPRMVTRALQPYADTALRMHFVANIDPADINDTLAELNPATTLFIISSKSFSTSETINNATVAKEWLVQACSTPQQAQTSLSQQCIAITAQTEKAIKFGVEASNILPLWDWVGGRYSVWSAIGLPVAIAIGMDRFTELLAGAHAMDAHFQRAPLTENMPVILALLGIWYRNFFARQTHTILPYAQYLADLPAYLQQLDMESNGKCVQRNGAPASYATGPVIWGHVESSGQHAFHQLLHQGTDWQPIDFIAVVKGQHTQAEQQRLAYANCLSQSRALMLGKQSDEIPPQADDSLTQAKVIPGNRPSNTIVLNELSPHTLGALLALYEHKVFVQSVVWNINPFDQWGVELGKTIVHDILKMLTADTTSPKKAAKIQLDSSTLGLLNYIK